MDAGVVVDPREDAAVACLPAGDADHHHEVAKHGAGGPSEQRCAAAAKKRAPGDEESECRSDDEKPNPTAGGRLKTVGRRERCGDVSR